MIGPLTLLLLLLSTSPAGSSDASDRQFRACLETGEAARGVDAAMKACAGAELQRRDARLNAAYRARIASLAPAARETLRRDERAWIRRRDASCGARMGPDTGSLGGLDYLDCMIDETRARTIRLVGRP